jgi:CRP/FNR family transcriptional regulator, cyclic AMP receptor protein
MARKSTYIDRLAAVPMFAALTKRELQQVASAADEIDVGPGTVLTQEGRTGHEFFLILSGKAIVRRNNRKVATLGPGQFFGELALLDRGPRTATVEADTDMTLLVLGQREFAGLLENVPGLASKILTGMAGRLRAADEKAISH